MASWTIGSLIIGIDITCHLKKLSRCGDQVAQMLMSSLNKTSHLILITLARVKTITGKKIIRVPSLSSFFVINSQGTSTEIAPNLSLLTLMLLLLVKQYTHSQKSITNIDFSKNSCSCILWWTQRISPMLNSTSTF